ncbi:hypothetical protein [uncultured Eubacterium sp.]|uniref:hypothetical protein n=1 Tax=uncultured Eubacterium sp. TaxID=165185 RepID=UPI00261C4F54|nr:hypothetical protein [uncultured Eubacterium sp.]
MQFMKMSYKGFEFNINPKNFKISMSKSTAKYNTVYDGQICTEKGKGCAVVSGKGYFVGADAAGKAFELVRVFNKKGSDYLFLPNSVPIKMHFTSLDISYSSGNDRVEYSFEFTQECNTKSEEHTVGYTYALENENLFDIASRTGVQIESIVKCNDIGDIFAVKEGEKIWLI